MRRSVFKLGYAASVRAESGRTGALRAGKEESETASIHRAEEARSRAQAGRASAGNAGTPARHHFATAEKDSRAAVFASARREAEGTIRLGQIQVD